MLMLVAVPVDSVLTPLQAFILGAVQGITELLPISSSAHLYLVPTLLGWRYEGVAFDVALHAGTLVALIGAFLDDWLGMARDAGSADPARRRDARMLFGVLVLGTIPALVAGKLLDDVVDQLRSVPLQAATLSVFGVLLWAADRFSPRADTVRIPSWRTALGIGLAQCLALVPGVSRSGITMTAGRVAGLSRVSAARFSFLLSTPITLAAVAYKMLKDADQLLGQLPLSTLLIGMVSSALFSFIAIRFMLGLLRRTGFGVFAVYRVALAAGLLMWAARA
jgi:undecaprenyl-diphosphatase